MGTLEAIRDELLARHAELRRAVDNIRNAVSRVRSGGEPADVLKVSLDQLAAVLHRHCDHEDEVLHDVIRKADAWGDVRAEMLGEEHAVEMRAIEEAVFQMRDTDDLDAIVAVTMDCVERVLQHMAREERYVIAADVLCDEIVARNSFCG